jgi:cytochrome c556
MRCILSWTIIGIIVLIAPVAAVASISLPPIMDSWNPDKHDVRAMLVGRTPYEEARIRDDLLRYIADASVVARELQGGTAEARNLAARFEAFATDSRSALGKISQPTAVAENFNRMLDDCRSCHAIYNN